MCKTLQKYSLLCDVHVTVHHDKPPQQNQPDTPISQIYSWNETLTCFGQFLCPSSRVFHCTHSNGICHTVLQTACKQDQDGTSWFCSQAVCITIGHIPLLCVQWRIPNDGQGIRMFHPDSAHKLSAKLYNIYHCCVYSEKLLMMDRGTVWNMYSFIPRINLRN
jgi:hypothetical protein